MKTQCCSSCEQTEGCCCNIHSRGPPNEGFQRKSHAPKRRRWRQPVFLQVSARRIRCHQPWDVRRWLPGQEPGDAPRGPRRQGARAPLVHPRKQRHLLREAAWLWLQSSSSSAATSPGGSSGSWWVAGIPSWTGGSAPRLEMVWFLNPNAEARRDWKAVCSLNPGDPKRGGSGGVQNLSIFRLGASLALATLLRNPRPAAHHREVLFQHVALRPADTEHHASSAGVETEAQVPLPRGMAVEGTPKGWSGMWEPGGLGFRLLILSHGEPALLGPPVRIAFRSLDLCIATVGDTDPDRSASSGGAQRRPGADPYDP